MSFYAIRHSTVFHYSEAARESVMEVRMQPLTELHQTCIQFRLSLRPHARSRAFRDGWRNWVHTFDIPAPHEQLSVVAESLVEVRPHPPLPHSLSPHAWDDLDALRERHDFYDWLAPSHFALSTPALEALAQELGFATRRFDPLTWLRTLNAALYEAFEYAPASTRADSPIDEALEARRGVCQDFAHIMTALARRVGLPCRYVSGYLARRAHVGDPIAHDRSAADASHAWVEAYLPEVGWVGFDPTNNLLCDERHIRVGVGRDYADVPPTRGVFKGEAQTRLEVAVQVRPKDALFLADEFSAVQPQVYQVEPQARPAPNWIDQQQQQQQQQ